MKCEFSYCIYNRDCNCIVSEIQINQLCMCDSCEIITVPEEDLEKYKEHRLKKIEEIWRNYDEQINYTNDSNLL